MLCRIALATFLALLLVSGVGACSILGMEDPAEMRAQAADARAQAELLLAEAQALRDEAAATTGDDSAKLIDAASKIESAADALRVAGQLADQGATAIEEQDFGPLIQTAAGILPPPFGILLGTAGTLIMDRQRRKTKGTLTRVVSTFEPQAGDAPLTESHKAALSTNLLAGDKKLISRIRTSHARRAAE